MRIALSEGRLSRWEDLLSELTYHDLQVLEAYYHIEPWGEERADLREAIMATSIASSFAVGEIDPDEYVERVEKLAGYMEREESKPKFVSPNAAAMTMKTAFPGK